MSLDVSRRERAYENRINEHDQRAPLKHRSPDESKCWANGDKEKSGGCMYSPLTWCDRQTSLKRLDSRLEARLTTLREKEISLEPNSGKEDLQTSTASALPTLSPLIQPQRPPEENTFQLNYPAGTKEPCQTKRERKREKTNKSSNHIKARHYLQTKESKKDRTNMRAYQNFLFRKIPRFIIYFAR